MPDSPVADSAIAAPAVHTVPSLLALGDEYVEHQKNLLLYGLHGTGKTTALKDLAVKHGLTYKYFSCSTMDPYTELVGIPVPVENEDGTRNLEMVRPQSVEGAQILIFDELNRASEATLNALMEITQFQTINGDPLPNLLMVWAAINPPKTELEYTVEELDRAFEDRFHAYIEIKPQPSVEYMATCMPRKIAVALKIWWDEHDQTTQDVDSYISPRRLVTIGQSYDQIGLEQAVFEALPMRGRYDSNKLAQLLKEAKYGISPAADAIGAGAADFRYTADGIKEDSRTIAEYLKDHPDNFETHKKVVAVFQIMHGTDMLHGYARVIQYLQPKLIEAMVAKMPAQKRVNLAREFNDLKPYRRNQMVTFANVLARATGQEVRFDAKDDPYIAATGGSKQSRPAQYRPPRPPGSR